MLLSAAVSPTLWDRWCLPYRSLNFGSDNAGLTSVQLHNAFGIDQGIDLATFNALGDAMQNPNGVGLGILKV